MADNLNINETVLAWSDILIEKWEEKIHALDISDTYALVESFKSEVIGQSGGDSFKIEFAFNYYGKFLDMGVGKGIPIGSVDGSRRSPKQWYSRTFFSEILKLSELLAEKFARKGSVMIVEQLNNMNKTV